MDYNQYVKTFVSPGNRKDMINWGNSQSAEVKQAIVSTALKIREMFYGNRGKDSKPSNGK